MSRLLSGRVKKPDFSELDPNRFEYLDLKNAQPELSSPEQSLNGTLINEDKDFLLISSYSGTEKTWTQTPGGLSLEGNKNKIKVRNTGVAGCAPALDDIDFGELVLNYKDARLFFKRLNEFDEEELFSLPDQFGNLDGGEPHTNFGGITPIDGGGVIQSPPTTVCAIGDL